jgi:hypothetical protein
LVNKQIFSLKKLIKVCKTGKSGLIKEEINLSYCIVVETSKFYNNNLFGLPQKNTSTRKSYISQKKIIVVRKPK